MFIDSHIMDLDMIGKLHDCFSHVMVIGMTDKSPDGHRKVA